jgi:uncharacterized protein (TIGR00369 family)
VTAPTDDEQEAVAPRGTSFHQHLGLRWETPAADDPAAVRFQVSVFIDVRPELCGPAGSLEGGVVATLVDVAGASCATRALQELVATQSISLSYLAPGRIGPIRATAAALRVGSDQVVVEVKVHDLGRDERLMSAAILTAKSLHVPIPADFG